MPIITIPRPLREKLGDEGAECLVEVFREWERGTKEDVIALSGEKFERRLVEETLKLDKRITEQVSRLDIRITDLRGELLERIDSVRGDLLERIDKNFRWTVGILLGTLIPMWVSIILVVLFKG